MRKVLTLRVLIILICFLSIQPVLLASGPPIQIGVDVVDIDSFFMDSLSLHLKTTFRFENFRVGLNLRYGQSYIEEFHYLEGGVELSIYPFSNGFFVGCSLLQVGTLWGMYAPDENFLLSGEGFIGWTFHFPYSFLEPRFSFSEAFDGEESMKALRSSVKQFSRFRLSLIFGVEF